MARWHLNGFLSHEMFSSLLWPKNAFHADYFSLQFEITKFRLHCYAKWFPCVLHLDPMFYTETPGVFNLDPVFSTRPRAFHQTPCFLHPMFSTRPRIFHTPGPRAPGPRTLGPRTPYPRTPAPRFPPSLPEIFFIQCSTILVLNFMMWPLS